MKIQKKVQSPQEKRRIKKNLKEIEQEIAWYDPKPSIKNAMLKLGRMGFAFSGHGYGMGEEDFSLENQSYFIALSDCGRNVEARLTTMDDEFTLLFEGTIGNLFVFMKKTLLLKVSHD